ncbi:hypothetical protein NDU88_008059 [Pleurodeles waltl]|uniref:Uncharacterized protein n=1 Tax=Pleurodeles waltl TaxID=8319 RepID=A0AAV7VV95_PLEWA|nr:hypothetical protein NDU88_008059 [Pleurodeles waltl]
MRTKLRTPSQISAKAGAAYASGSLPIASRTAGRVGRGDNGSSQQDIAPAATSDAEPLEACVRTKTRVRVPPVRRSSLGGISTTTAPWKYSVVKTTSSGPGAGGHGGKHQQNQSPPLPRSPSPPKPTTHGQRCNPRTTRSTTWHRSLGPGLAVFRLRRERLRCRQPPSSLQEPQDALTGEATDPLSGTWRPWRHWTQDHLKPAAMRPAAA